MRSVNAIKPTGVANFAKIGIVFTFNTNKINEELH